MLKSWNVYKADGAFLGTYSSAEIRQGLRDGRLDPFDQVARVGANERLPLVEVDEIFVSEGREEPVAAQTKTYVANVEPAEETQDEGPQVGTNIAASVGVSEGNLAVGKSFVVGSKPLLFQKKRKLQTNKKRLRRYFVLDKQKRLLGPLSAAEIQSLFNRGILEKNVRVTRENSNHKVPITQFLAAYNGEKNRKGKERPRESDYAMISAGYPSTKVMDQMTRTVQTNSQAKDAFIPVISLAAMGLLIAMSYFFVKQIITNNSRPASVFEELLPRKSEEKMNQPSNNLQIEEGAPIQIQPKISRPKDTIDNVIRPIPREEPPPPAKRAKPKPKPKVQPAPVYEEPLPRPQYVAPLPRFVPTYRPQPTVVARPRPTQRVVTPPRQQQRPAARAPVARIPAAPVARAAAPTQARGGADPFAIKAGKVATLVNLSFSMPALNACGMKCTLSMREPGGRTIQAIFFKGAFLPQLQRSGGKATVSGKVDKRGTGDYVIYLQGVR